MDESKWSLEDFYNQSSFILTKDVEKFITNNTYFNINTLGFSLCILLTIII